MPKVYIRPKYNGIDLPPGSPTELGLTPEQQFKEAGWVQHHAGGGCAAWEYLNTDMTYFLATDDSGINLPEDLNSVILGHYDDQGEPLSQPYLVTMDQVLFIIKAYNQMVEEYRDES